ncbi:hypothetical protein NLU14_11545 [Marinobacter sp. 71-i]|uniref:Integrase n=1 Tax=Marinobacter iranensis TaxID=2962607 RepID=A0ABT5YBB7_9GAMM|nr:hypothetical protein [Marinobacter iranensis]MDF0750859.1 hypothetical protein [Marinobacter iranensis]
MTSLDPLEANRREHIAALRAGPLEGYRNNQGLPATFDDVAWQFTWPDGRKINLLFHERAKIPARHLGFSNLKQEHRLPDDPRHLLMAYAIDLVASKLAMSNKANLVAQAKALLRPAIHTLTQTELERVVAGLSFDIASQVRYVFNWLQNHRFVSATLNYPTLSKSDCTERYYRAERSRKKKPEDKVLLALGAIFYEAIPPDERQWDFSPSTSQRDAMVTTLAALAMASPNRVAAEIPALANQPLQSSVDTASGQRVHWLDWPGSKGYKDNRNHLLANLIDPLQRGLAYCRQATEPARVLARFYQTPRQSLRQLLGEFTPEPERLIRTEANLDDPTHLLQLGYLLGFYPLEATVAVDKGTTNAARMLGPPGHAQLTRAHWRKSIYALKPQDRVILTSKASIELFGTQLTTEMIATIWPNRQSGPGKRPHVTVSALQAGWLAHIHKVHPGFPRAYASGNNWVNAYQALFIYRGPQLLSGNSTYPGQRSFYGLIMGKSLAQIFALDINPGQASRTIFGRHGFADDFAIRPHQFRHWLNDEGERAGLSHQMVNLWSGRRSPEQILYYLHSSEDERASAIQDIWERKPDEASKKAESDPTVQPIRVYTMQEHERLSGLRNGAASVTAVGFCQQDLVVEPCRYLNDFELQCTLCAEACHVKGDDQALKLLRYDLTVQQRRLQTIQDAGNFANSKHMQMWFKTHQGNTELLQQLIDLLQDPSIRDGSVIRVVLSKAEFRITDLATKVVTIRKLALPDRDGALQQALEQNTPPPEQDDFLSDFLNHFGGEA